MIVITAGSFNGSSVMVTSAVFSGSTLIEGISVLSSKPSGAEISLTLYVPASTLPKSATPFAFVFAVATCFPFESISANSAPSKE